MKTFSFTFRTPFETIKAGEIEWLTMDTAGGNLKILPSHASLIDHVPFSFVKYQHENKEYGYFVRSGVLHVNNEKNEVDLHCLFADATEKTVHTTVDEHLSWIKQQLADHESGAKIVGSYEHSFLQKE